MTGRQQLAKHDLLIVDELGYVPLSKTGAELVFEGLTDLEEVRDIGSDPCSPDTDEDGASDGVNTSPLDLLIQ